MGRCLDYAFKRFNLGQDIFGVGEKIEKISSGIIEHKWDISEELRRVTALVAVHD